MSYSCERVGEKEGVLPLSGWERAVLRVRCNNSVTLGLPRVLHMFPKSAAELSGMSMEAKSGDSDNTCFLIHIL